ncbi:TPR-like protein [Thelephora terrestris]|uniref:TPR-like protein n=1 Tax=Thelephora terrestris TaxID=56493 RepID=A0A9P6HH52_9AGAM|nr:TPR-like protein [Thelephora terrestris]
MSAEDPAGYEGKGKEIQIADLEEAERLKQEGNNHFRSKAWEEALAHYRSALGYLPRREHEPPREPTEPSGQPDLEVVGLSPSEAPSATPPQPNIGETPEMVKMRAVLNGNVAACYVQLGEHNKVVEACTEALADDPTYVKALQRRAASNEAIASWSALTSAQEDYRTLLKLLPESSPQRSEIDRMLRNLGPRIEMKRKEEMGDDGQTEGTWKQLPRFASQRGFLSNFGLSTDNFKFEPSGQGGYSVNFSR